VGAGPGDRGTDETDSSRPRAVCGPVRAAAPTTRKSMESTYAGFGENQYQGREVLRTVVKHPDAANILGSSKNMRSGGAGARRHRAESSSVNAYLLARRPRLDARSSSHRCSSGRATSRVRAGIYSWLPLGTGVAKVGIRLVGRSGRRRRGGPAAIVQPRELERSRRDQDLRHGDVQPSRRKETRLACRRRGRGIGDEHRSPRVRVYRDCGDPYRSLEVSATRCGQAFRVLRGQRVLDEDATRRRHLDAFG